MILKIKFLCVNFIMMIVVNSCSSEEKITSRNKNVIENRDENVSISSAEGIPRKNCVAPQAKSSLGLVNAMPLKIMPIGDSITHGSTGLNWRCFLWTYLHSQEIFQNVSFVGTQKSPYLGSNAQCTDRTFDVDHEGHGGLTTDAVLNDFLPNSVAINKPDVALIHMGTNDLARGDGAENVVGEVKSMIELLRQNNASVTVFVAGIIPNLYTVPSVDSQTRELNTKLEALTKTLATNQSMVVFVNQYEGFDGNSDLLDDKLHPNYQGHVKMANKWYFAMYGFFTNRPILAEEKQEQEVQNQEEVQTTNEVENKTEEKNESIKIPSKEKDGVTEVSETGC